MNQKFIWGEFGTFDVENYGDLLYPVIFKKMIRKRDERIEIRHYSFMGSESLQNSGYNTRPIREMFSSRADAPGSLIIGGGDLLRTDWDTMASHYRSFCLSRNDPPPPFSLRLLFKRFLNRQWTAEKNFRVKYMNYPAVGPFIIKPRKFHKKIAYCSCGVPFPFDEKERRGVAKAFNKSIFLSVRDRQSKDSLVQAGVSRKIHVGPDLIVVLSDFFDPASEREKGRRILQARGVDLNRKLLVFQCCPQPPEKGVELTKQLKAYQQRTGCEVLLLPLARCHGDNDYLGKLASDAGGAFKYIELNSIFDILAALAACDVFVGTSLHGNITAFSFGIPHLFGPIPSAKCEGFLEVVNLPLELKLASWAEINQKLELVEVMGKKLLADRVPAAKQRVNEVFDLLFQAVTNTSPWAAS